MPKFNPLEYVTRDTEREKSDPEGRMWFALDPDVAYPAAIAAIRNGGVRADEHLLAHAKDINDLKGSEGWELALKPKSEVPAEKHALREKCLEHARRWFTAVLHRFVKDEHGEKGLGIKIKKSDRWKL